MIYDVLVESLHPNYRRHITRWVRGIEANSLTEACRIAEARHPNLGLTPTITSMAWHVWPQPKGASKCPVDPITSNPAPEKRR